ncbi:MAG TPA: PD-(D/E)XK nuclease-like domain-containing protein [Burkholderiales bacterium]|nr:PD-(D/E)XK nuclease-like domain-containing protein [Burkholderiales bacterium]
MSAVSKAVSAALPPARILDCDVETYHKDPCDESIPSLSATTAHIIESKSCLHAWTNHPRHKSPDDEDEEPEDDKDTKARVNGKLIHRLVLGKGEELVVVEADSWRTKAAREQRDEAKAAGKLPVLVTKLDELTIAADFIREGFRREGFDLTGASEVPVMWYERGAAGPVLCRSLIDHLYLEDGVVIDVKTTRNAHPDDIARHFVEYGYDIQARAYTRAVENLRPELAGRIKFYFIFCELTPPYAVVPIEPEPAFEEIGKRRWGSAVSKWEACLAAQRWPSYVSGLHRLVAPEYIIRRYLEDWAA